MKKLIMPVIGLAAALTQTVGAAVVADFFVRREADALLPFTDRDKRLDMLEYFKADGAESRVAPDGAPASFLSITSLTDSAMTVSTRGVTVDIAMFVPAPADTLIVVSTNLQIGGQTDSSVEYFDSSLQPKGRVDQPAYTEWIVPSMRPKATLRVAESVPYVPAKAILDPATCTVTFVNTAVTEFAEPKDIFRPSISYRYIKDSFKEVK